jgi:hypothetical protein
LSAIDDRVFVTTAAAAPESAATSVPEMRVPG